MVASMSVSRLAISLASLLLVLPTQPSSAMDSNSASTQSEAAGPSPARAIGHLPLAFEENFGQAGSDTRFLARSPNYTVLLGDTQATVVFQEASQRPRIGRAIQSSRAVMGSLLLNLIGATRSGDATGENVLAARSNYFIGNDPALWHTNIPTYSRVRYSSIYKGIDLVYYGNDENLEYDFILHPGSDSETIRFGLDHSTSVQLQANGDLLVRVGNAKLQLRKPVAYQIIRGQKTKIESHFRMLGKGQYGLRIGHYDARYDLIVDPVLTYSTYLGGKDDEGIFGIAFDNDRNLYVAGETSSVNFPTKNPFQAQVGGSYDAFVSKFDPTGKKLIYSTYLGGNDYDHAVGLRVDRQGRAYLAGITFSADFPVQNALQTTKGGPADGFVAKLGQSGSELIFSTFLGGNGFDEVNAITLGQDDSIYVTGFTNSSDFPTTPNALSTKCDGGVQPFCIGDAFVAKLDLVGQTLLYSTYVGGSSYDSANGIAVDARGNAYITGQTQSSDFPVHNAYQGTNGGAGDAFVVKLNDRGSNTVWSTYLGGSNYDDGTDIAVDHEANVYVTGITASTDFPVARAFQSANKGGQFDGFVAKLTTSGSQLVYSTYLGGSGLDFPFRIAILRHEEAAVIGFTSSTDFPLQSPLQTSYAGGNTDGFVTRFSRQGDQLRFSTYLGGTGDEYGYAITRGCDDTVWVGGSTSSKDYPLKKSFQHAYAGGPFDAFLTAITDTHSGGSGKTLDDPGGGSSCSAEDE
jgi:hypothetical protein